MFEMRIDEEWSGFDLGEFVDHQWDDYNEAEEGVDAVGIEMFEEMEGWED